MCLSVTENGSDFSIGTKSHIHILVQSLKVQIIIMIYWCIVATFISLLTLVNMKMNQKLFQLIHSLLFHYLSDNAVLFGRCAWHCGELRFLLCCWLITCLHCTIGFCTLTATDDLVKLQKKIKEKSSYNYQSPLMIGLWVWKLKHRNKILKVLFISLYVILRKAYYLSLTVQVYTICTRVSLLHSFIQPFVPDFIGFFN